MSKQTMRFSHFLEYFPTIELPINIGEETHHIFSQQNEPLPPLVIEKFIQPLETDIEEGEEEAEFVEYVPCFRIPKTDAFHAIVYWRAGLMNYRYMLVTFEPDGTFIAKKAIAGTFTDGSVLTQSVATIEDDWMIYVVTGFGNAADDAYDAANSKAIDLELLPDGSIINAI